MTDSINALREKVKHPDEEIDYALDFTHFPLREGETIASITSVVAVRTDGPSLPALDALAIDDGTLGHTAPAVNTATILDDEETPVAIGKAVVFWLLKGVDQQVYRIKARVVTSLGRKIVGQGVLRIDDGVL